MLQREFKSKDVQRMRNIITKNYTAKTSTQVGYTKKQIDHKEGDVWEEDGKQWTIKNGIKQTITRFDELKKLVVLPIVCPNCGKAMKSTTLNKKMWPIHGNCFECVINMETELKRNGQYDEYARKLTHRGVEVHIKEMEDALMELALMGNENDDFITEAGDVEKWTGNGVAKEQITKDLQEYIQKLKDYVES